MKTQQGQRNGLDPAQDALCKTKCGSMKLFCLCLPEKQLHEYKAQLQGSEEFITDGAGNALPKALRDRQDQPQEHPLLRLLEVRLIGRCAEAEKELRDLRQLLESRQGGRSEAETRLLRLATKYVDFLCPLRLQDLNLPITGEHSSLPLSYGKRIKDGFVEWFSVGDYAGCDLLRALATYLEVDLSGKFYTELPFTPKELGASNESSAIWHIANINKVEQQNIREDNVYQYQVVNALDEEAGSLLLLKWSLVDDAVCKRPAPLQNFLRSGFECTIYRFVPHYDPSTRTCNGLRLARANITRPPPSLYGLAAEIDEASLRDSTKIGNENFYTKFRTHLTACAVEDRARLEKKMKEGPRRALYAKVRKQLERGPKKLSSLQRLGQICCSNCRS